MIARFTLYCVASIALAAGVFIHHAVIRPNYYSALVAIASGNLSWLIVGNLCMMFLVLFGWILQCLMFGDLRIIEREHLYDKLWYSVSEMFLALTLSHGYSPQFLACFSGVLFCKVIHGVAHDRVDYVFQIIGREPSFLDISRLAASLLVIIVFDTSVLRYTLSEELAHGPTLLSLVVYEMALMLLSSIHTSGKFVLNYLEMTYLLENEEEDVWEPKTSILLVFDIISDFIRICLYTVFFVVIIKPHGAPLHMVRDLYLTVAHLLKRINEFKRFKVAKAQLDVTIPNAVPEDLERDNICIICREEMDATIVHANDRHVPKRLGCRHVIHRGCLKSWLERSQHCPTCRTDIDFEKLKKESAERTLQQQQSGGTSPGNVGETATLAAEMLDTTGQNPPQPQQDLASETQAIAHDNSGDETPAADMFVDPSTIPDKNDNIFITHHPIPAGWKGLRLRKDPETSQLSVDTGLNQRVRIEFRPSAGYGATATGIRLDEDF